MHTFGAFDTFGLHIRPGDPRSRARVKVMVQPREADDAGRLFITPECTSLDELKGQINALQDDLDQLRAS